MIDLHCHYLPGVDDGARDMTSALTLANASVLNGITHAVLTPHVYAGRWENTLSRARPVFEQYRQALQDEQIALQVSLGGEVHLLPEALTWLDTDELPFLGGWRGNRVVLLELPDGGIPVGTMRAVEYFLERGVTPMIAHPERNKDVMRSLAKIEPFVQAGCLLQLTAASVCGWFGRNAHRSAIELLDSGWVTVVATDAHNIDHRPPVLAQAREQLCKRYGENAGPILTETNPALIVSARSELGLDD